MTLLYYIIYKHYVNLFDNLLGVKGVISALEVDTNFFTGNYPESCLVSDIVVSLIGIMYY